MIRFLLTRGHSYTVKSVCRAPRLSVSPMNYDALIRARWLRRATYIFTDLDRLSHWDLDLAGEIYLQLKNAGLTVLNNPARVKARYALSRALHSAGLNDFNVHRADELNPAIRFPVFVRKTQGHRKPLSDLLPTREQLDKTIESAVAAGTSLENLLVVEFAAEAVRPGLYRKLSAFRIGDVIVPHISVHDTSWLVKYGKMFDSIEDLYEEEHRMFQTNPFADHLKKVFDIAGIEYGRADFGIYRGRIQVYEINTNPHVAPACKHPSATRVANMSLSWEKYLEALRAMDSRGGWPIRLADGKLQRHRPWKNLLVRTRKVKG
jgi:hypothetical protein